MAASVAEQILARVQAALAGAATAAGSHVYLEMDDALGDGVSHAIVIKREDTAGEMDFTGAQIETVSWAVEHHASGANPATLADALHMQVHAALWADATLATIGKGLRCTGTECETETRDRAMAKLTAHYRMKVFVRPGDLTRAIT